jgi:hypothetical protein
MSEEKEKEPVKKRQKINMLSKEEIYKVSILNAEGRLDTIYIFCANTCNKSHLPELFSDTQLAYFDAENVKILFTEESLIHADDSIQMVKRKIIQELLIHQVKTSIDQLYLFSSASVFLDMNEIYQEATQQESIPFVRERFFHYALNMNLDPFSNDVAEDEELSLQRRDTLHELSSSITKENPTYENWMELRPSGSHEIGIPLGFRFKQRRSYGFSANPFHTQSTMDFVMSPKNPLLQFDNTLLLNYTTSRDITVCFAKDVFTYAEKQGLNESNMMMLYYPGLYSRGIETSQQLQDAADDLSDESAKKWTAGVQEFCQTLASFHKIYSLRKGELDYTERGIQSYSLLISSGDSDQILPLDIIFKQLHATREVPFIKYNPGYRRENMYRLYANRLSTNGKKIPLLSETAIMRLSRELGKSNQIAMLLPGKPLDESGVDSGVASIQHDIHMSLDSGSGILISGVCSVCVLPSELEAFLIERVNPMISRINATLQSAGYSLRPFLSLSDDTIETAKYTYKAVLPIQNAVSLDKQTAYIPSVMDIISTNVAKGASFLYKRVENFREMDSQSALITEIYRDTGRMDTVVQALIENYGLTEEAAGMRVAKYMSEHQQVKGKLLDNPGFPVVFKMRPLKSEIIVEVEKVGSVAYIDLLHTYIDTILRITQDPTSTDVPTGEMKRFRAKTKHIIVQEELMAEDNVAAPKGMDVVDFYKVQPLRFGKEALEKTNDVLDAGLDAVLLQEDADDTTLQDRRQEQGEDVEADAEAEDEGEGFLFDDDFAYDEEAGNSEGQESLDETKGGKRKRMGGEDTPEDQELKVDNQEEGQEEEEQEVQEKYKENIDGMSIKGPTSYFVKRMQDRDPKLFLTEVQGKYELYSRSCPSSDKRQPVILTDEEKRRIDETNPGSYEHAVKYGSTPDKQHWYVCPRYWCLKTNSSISEEDVKAGKCGTIIPPNAKVVPPGAYVYEFSNQKEHIDKNGEYIKHVPGFLEKDKHPDGLCIPCCFKKAWDAKQNRDRRAQCAQDDGQGVLTDAKGKKGNKSVLVGQAPVQKVISYIMSPVSCPLPQHRWGFLPMSIQFFLDIDNSLAVEKQNPSIIRAGASTMLRYGVEHTGDQAFLGVIAHFYAYKHNLATTPTISEIRRIIAESVNLDLFLKVQNGNLPAIFKPKRIEQGSIDIDSYTNTEFYKRLQPNLKDEAQLDYLEDTIASYEAFKEYIEDESSVVDHSYLWDLFCERNPLLMRDGFNLIILQLPESDITDNVELVCPSNSYSSTPYDPTKESVILVKQGPYYEPIHWYEQLNNGDISIKKAFLERLMPQNIKDLLAMIQVASRKYCSPQPSKPRVYKFKRGLPVQETIRLLKTHQYRVEGQVSNYRNKIIGLQVNKSADQGLLFVPCYPSSAVDGIPIKQMDDDDLWLDYRLTRDRLMGLSKETGGKLLCKPVLKVVDSSTEEGRGLVVGIITETNQFVQIDPPQQMGYDEDDLEVLQHSDYALSGSNKNTRTNAEKVMTMSKTEDQERATMIHKISMESQFYNAFRSLVRMELNQYEHRVARKLILDLLDSPSTLYHSKLTEVEKTIRDILADRIVFQVLNDAVVQELDSIGICEGSGSCSGKKYCLTTEEGECKTIFPKTHLVSGTDNERIYFARIADELIRYRRIRVFLLYPKQYLNVSRTDYNIADDELFLLETLLTKEYFRDLVAYTMNKHVQNIGYDNANPESSQTYENRIPLEEQDALIEDSTKKTGMGEYILDCIKETRQKVVGNDKPGSWRTFFPVGAKELVFESSVLCSFIPMIYILQERTKNQVSISIQNIKTQLWNGYGQYMELYRDKILAILRKQGKRELMDMIKSGKSTFEHVLFSDTYYITDLDWWIFCQVSKLPVILFSSTSLKSIMASLEWLRLGHGSGSQEKYWFVRSPADVGVNAAPAYHLIVPPYSFTEMRNDMFLRGERGAAEYEKNIGLTVDEYLSTFHLIVRGRTKKEE